MSVYLYLNIYNVSTPTVLILQGDLFAAALIIPRSLDEKDPAGAVQKCLQYAKENATNVKVSFRIDEKVNMQEAMRLAEEKTGSSSVGPHEVEHMPFVIWNNGRFVPSGWGQPFFGGSLGSDLRRRRVPAIPKGQQDSPV